LNPTLLRNLRADVDKALAPLLAAYKLSSLKVGAGTYTRDGSFTFKLEGVTEGGLTRDASAYESWRAMRPNLPPLGSTIEVRGRPYIVRGMNRTGTKVKAEAGGKTWLLPIGLVPGAVTP
jgi:hypothetical protein